MKVMIPYERVRKAEGDYNTMIELSKGIRYRYNRKNEPIDFYLYVPDGVDLGTQEMEFFTDLCNAPYYEANKIAILHEQLIKDPRKIKVEAEESKEPINIEYLQKAIADLHSIIRNLGEFKESLSKTNIGSNWFNHMRMEKAYLVAVTDMIYLMDMRLHEIADFRGW